MLVLETARSKNYSLLVAKTLHESNMPAVKYPAVNCSNHKNKQIHMLCPVLPFQNVQFLSSFTFRLAPVNTN